MTRYVALLRGVNVGGRRKVPMARLRGVLEGLGFTDVATLLQSGNAVFTGRREATAPLAGRIEAALLRESGFPVDVIVRTRAELAAVVAANPLRGAAGDPSRFLVFFLSGPPDRARLAAVDPEAFLPDEFRAAGRAIYARFPGGIAGSRLAALLGGPATGGRATARNWSTVTALLALAAPGAGRAVRSAPARGRRAARSTPRSRAGRRG